MKKRSVLYRFLLLMNIAYVLLAILSALTIRALYRRENAAFEDGLRRSVQGYVRLADDTLEAVDVHLREVMGELADESSAARIRSGISYRRKVEEHRYYEFLLRKCAGVRGMDIAFVIDSRGPSRIWACATGLSGQDRASFRAYLNEDAFTLLDCRQQQWRPRVIDGVLYYSRLYSVNGFIVGTLCREDAVSGRFWTPGEAGAPRSFALLDQNGEVLYEDPGPEGASRGTVSVISEAFPSMGGTIRFVFVNDILRFFRSTTLLGILLLGITCLLAEGVAYLFLYRRMVTPIRGLVGASDEIIGGNYDYEVPVDATGELRVLQQAFRAAIRTVKNQRIASYEQELRSKEQELRGLRQQLKPHFYLNAMAVVKGMAFQGKTDDILRYIDALTVHVRYLINSGQEVISLEREFVHVRNYVDMQKICFPGAITAFLRCDPAVRETPIPYLLLHTLVENAFKHGFGEKHILMFTLSASPVPGGVLIEYEDSGEGFPPEYIERFAAGAGEPSAHVGLFNLRRTLEIRYGRPDLLTISNVQPGGARVEILIPADEERHETD